MANILENEIDKRLDGEGGYTTIDNIPEDWASYHIQDTVNDDGAPTEQTIRLIDTSIGMDIVTSSEKLRQKEPDLLIRGLQPYPQAPDTVTVEDYEAMESENRMEF